MAHVESVTKEICHARLIADLEILVSSHLPLSTHRRPKLTIREIDRINDLCKRMNDLCKRMNDLCKRMSDLCKRIEWDVTT